MVKGADLQTKRSLVRILDSDTSWNVYKYNNKIKVANGAQQKNWNDPNLLAPLVGLESLVFDGAGRDLSHAEDLAVVKVGREEDGRQLGVQSFHLKISFVFNFLIKIVYKNGWNKLCTKNTKSFV